MKAIIIYAKTEVVRIMSQFVLLILYKCRRLVSLKHDTISGKDLTFKRLFYFQDI